MLAHNILQAKGKTNKYAPDGTSDWNWSNRAISGNLLKYHWTIWIYIEHLFTSTIWNWEVFLWYLDIFLLSYDSLENMSMIYGRKSYYKKLSLVFPSLAIWLLVHWICFKDIKSIISLGYCCAINFTSVFHYFVDQTRKLVKSCQPSFHFSHNGEWSEIKLLNSSCCCSPKHHQIRQWIIHNGI